MSMTELKTNHFTRIFRRVTIQWFFLIGLYTSFEYGNCLMYIQDSVSVLDSYFICYLMCLGEWFFTRIFQHNFSHTVFRFLIFFLISFSAELRYRND